MVKVILTKNEKKSWIELMKEKKKDAREQREKNKSNLERIREIIKQENTAKMKLQAIENVFNS